MHANASAGTAALVLVAFLFVYPVRSDAGNEQGKAALERGDYATALREFTSEAHTGNALAQFALGLMHANGFGVPRDGNAALTWFSRAGEAGNGYAQYNSGLLHMTGHAGVKNVKEAIAWFRKAADTGLTQAQTDLGALHFFGHYKDIEYPEAVSWLRKAAGQGHPAAQINLAFACLLGGVTVWKGTEGTLFSSPIGVAGTAYSKNESEAVRWFTSAGEQGAAIAQFNLGRLYEQGIGVERDHATAVQWYTKAVANGFTPALMNLAALLESASGQAQDRAKALQLRMQSSRLGYNKTRKSAIVVWYFGSQTLKKLDAHDIANDLRRIAGVDDQVALHSFSPALLVDPALTIAKPVQAAYVGRIPGDI